MDSSKFYQLVGEFCVQFEEVCYQMEECAMHILDIQGLKNRSIAKVLISNLTAEPLQKMLRALLSEHLKSFEYNKILSLVFAEFTSLIESRNSIVHAKWIAPIDDKEWQKPCKSVLSRKLKTNGTGESAQYLKYSEEDFNKHINACMRLKKIIEYLCFLCEFPEMCSSRFKIDGKKLLLPHEFE
jgi:hypothetical protein